MNTDVIVIPLLLIAPAAHQSYSSVGCACYMSSWCKVMPNDLMHTVYTTDCVILTATDRHHFRPISHFISPSLHRLKAYVLTFVVISHLNLLGF